MTISTSSWYLRGAALSKRSISEFRMPMYVWRKGRENWMTMEWGSTQLCPTFCVLNHEQQYPISHERQTIFRIKRVDSWYGYTEEFKMAMFFTALISFLCCSSNEICLLIFVFYLLLELFLRYPRQCRHQNLVEKKTRFCCFFSLKSPGGHAVYRQNAQMRNSLRVTCTGERTYVTVTWVPNFLVSIGFHFSSIVMEASLMDRMCCY